MKDVTDFKLEVKELKRWRYGETEVALFANQIKGCYTMSFYKYGKLISEVHEEENDVGNLIAKLIDTLRIEINQLQVN